MGLYSLEDLALEIEFDVEDFKPLLQLFVDTTRDDLDKIRLAALKEEPQAVSTAVHNIRGSSLNLGLVVISGMTEHLSRLNKNESFTDIENIIRECEAELSDLEKLVE
ncbi:MAG: Hpt domain-containing protein [Spirochaetales bacterium]|nr:Hpt domain-containing protein [Spirochaetales bacterium]